MKKTLQEIKIRKLNHFLFGEFERGYMLSNDWGEVAFVSKVDFWKFLKGELEKESSLYKELEMKGFIKNEKLFPFIIQKYQQKKTYLKRGPRLHIIVVTGRCNLKCIYCHASAQDMKKKEYDMDKKTAKQVVDRIFETPLNEITIEFQGGEPLVNWEVIKFIVKYAQEKNKKIGKKISFALVSNFSLMNEEKFKFLVQNKVSLAGSLDGDEDLQKKNRPMPNGNSFIPLKKWSKFFFKRYDKLKEEGYFPKMATITTITKFSLKHWKEIIDTHLELGFDRIFIRPVDPFGFSKKGERKWEMISCTPEEFLDFYKNCLEYILEVNRKGKKFREIFTSIFVSKIFSSEDPDFMDLRSPCGAGLGQLAYHYNGNVYSCDEGRMVSMMGDESFYLGNVFKNSLKEIIDNPIVRTLCISSCLESLPGCESCVFRPFCGVCPIYNYSVYGNIFPKSFNKNERCIINKGILSFIFHKIKENKEDLKIMKKWIKN